MKPVWRETNAQHSVKQWASPVALWAVSWCCMGAPGIQQCFVCTHGFSAYHWVVAVERVGVGGVVLISLCLCVLVCERQRESEQEIAMGLCEARMPGEMFCTVGVFLQDVKHLCWSGGVMCEVHSTRSTAGKV